MENEYEECRNIYKNKNYELIYDKLLIEISNIKDRSLNIEDTSNIKTYLEEEIRKRIFKKKGIPSFIFKIIVLLGEDYEETMKVKINNFLVSEYVTEFQLFISEEFRNLSDIKKYYKKINQILKEIKNVYFNLPDKWNTKEEILSDIYIIVKQKICDIIFFNNFEIDDYLEAVKAALENERNICEILGSVKKSIFHLLVPFLKPYFDFAFESLISIEFDVKNTEMKIFTNFVTYFKEFAKIYDQVSYFENRECIKIFSSVFSSKLIELLNYMSKIQLYLDYENEGSTEYNRKDFNRIIVVLNTISYLNDCVADLNSNLYCTYEINLPQDLFVKLGHTENIFNGILEIYIRNLIAKVDFTNHKVSLKIIQILRKDIFFIDLEDLFEDLRINISEIIILQILSRIYLLDFNEEDAELMIYDLYELKTYLNDYCTNIGSFNILESYLKIFMCSPKDMQTFVENFKILSNEIFSFRQIVWSLKDKDFILDLLEIYENLK